MKMTSSPLPNRPPVGGVYPTLSGYDDQAFRLSETRRVRDHLEEDVRRHGTTRRRYKRAANALTYTGIVTNTAAAGCGGAAVATLAGGITAPASLVLGAVALGSGGIGTACTVAGKLLERRIVKNERIETAAKTRRDAVSAVTSKALSDQRISQDEFAVVLQQGEQFRRQKAELWAAGRGANGDLEKAKKELWAQARAEVSDLLAGRSPSR